jgi:hypothetical protein
MRTRLTPDAIRAVSSLRRAITPRAKTVPSSRDTGMMYVRMNGSEKR